MVLPMGIRPKTNPRKEIKMKNGKSLVELAHGDRTPPSTKADFIVDSRELTMNGFDSQ